MHDHPENGRGFSSSGARSSATTRVLLKADVLAMTATMIMGLPDTVVETINHGLAEDWHRFGIYIGFTSSQLENLQTSVRTMGLCCAVSRMLAKWSQVTLQTWTVEKCLKFIGSVLEQIERRDILEDINISVEGIIELDEQIQKRLGSICLSIMWPTAMDVRLQSRVEKWKKDNELFYETRAYQHTRRIVEDKGIVFITGKQGDGKTFIAEHLLLTYLCLGYELVLVGSPEEWRHRWNPTVKQIIFIDDVFGKTLAFPSIALEQWVLLGQEMTECIEGGVTKVISTVRDYIHKDCQGVVRGVEIFRNIVNISCDDWKLTPEEKFQMLVTHQEHFDVAMDRDQMREIARKDYIQGFPLRCRLFFADERLKKQGRGFFLGNLCDVLVDELRYMEDTDKNKYLALVMLLFCDGMIPDAALFSARDQNIRTRIGNLLGLTSVGPICRLFSILKPELGLDNSVDLDDLLANLYALTGTYIIREGAAFRFVHESIADAIAYTFGNSVRRQNIYISYCSISELQQRIILTPNDRTFHDNKYRVVMRESSYYTLAKRLTEEVEAGHASDLFTDSRFFRKDFPKTWKEFLSGLNSKRLKHIFELKDRRGNTFYSVIARQGCIPLLELILSIGSSPSASQLMLQAASTGQSEAVKLLLKEGANINEKTSHGQTALLLSSVEGHISLSNCLLENGADVNITDAQGCSPLHSACAHGQLPIVVQLLKYGAEVDARDTIGSTGLFYASLKGHADIVAELLQQGTDINISNQLGGDPLLASCVNGHIAVLKLLLEKDPDLNHKDYKGKTPLHWASQRGYVDIVHTLICKGADVTLADENWQTSLHMTAVKGHTHIWRLLVRAGADMYVTDTCGKTPVALANMESKIPSLFDF